MAGNDDEATLERRWRRGELLAAYEASRRLRDGDTAASDSPYRGTIVPLDAARRLHDHGRRAWHVARFEDADRSLGEAHALRRDTLGADHPDTLDTLERRAALAGYRCDNATAAAWFAEVIVGLADRLGPAHVRVAVARRNHGAFLRDVGDHDGAHAELAAAGERLRVLPPEHPDHIDWLKAHALLELAHDPRAALASAERAAELGARCWDVEHPFVAAAHLTAGQAELALARLRPARQRLARAAELLERAYGAHPLVAIALHARGRVELHAGDDLGLAERLIGDAAALYGRFYAGAPVFDLRATIVDVYLERGALDEAVAAAPVLYAGCSPPTRAAIADAVACALLEAGQIAAGVSWLERARAATEDPDLAAELAGAIAAWRDYLAEHAPDGGPPRDRR